MINCQTDETKQPKDWLTINELQKYVRDFDRHWSRPYIHSLINDKKLKSFKISSTRLFLKKDVNSCIQSFKHKSPPIMVKQDV